MWRLAKVGGARPGPGSTHVCLHVLSVVSLSASQAPLGLNDLSCTVQCRSVQSSGAAASLGLGALPFLLNKQGGWRQADHSIAWQLFLQRGTESLQCQCQTKNTKARMMLEVRQSPLRQFSSSFIILNSWIDLYRACHWYSFNRFCFFLFYFGEYLCI